MYRHRYNWTNQKQKIYFGKYEGKTIKQVLNLDPSYILWVDRTCMNVNVSKNIFLRARELFRQEKERINKRRFERNRVPLFHDEVCEVWPYAGYVEELSVCL